MPPYDFDDDVLSTTIEDRGGELCAVFKLVEPTYTCVDGYGRAQTYDPTTSEKSVLKWTDEIALPLDDVVLRANTAIFCGQDAPKTNAALRALKLSK